MFIYILMESERMMHLTVQNLSGFPHEIHRETDDFARSRKYSAPLSFVPVRCSPI